MSQPTEQSPERPSGRAVPTSADVARLAGVSWATVSYVLNNTSAVRISEPTRQRVREAAEELGYVPHAAPAACARATAAWCCSRPPTSRSGRCTASSSTSSSGPCAASTTRSCSTAASAWSPGRPPAPGPSCGRWPWSPSARSSSPGRASRSSSGPARGP
ncbi:LacI family DNA-binding transcriptional regulator [Streptomyces diastatochromogenes]|nr:LacI family DNA-binding transcriptional regulator [Streptomyces diastatochromogenes]